jgi:hypothetical protein
MYTYWSSGVIIQTQTVQHSTLATPMTSTAGTVLDDGTTLGGSARALISRINDSSTFIEQNVNCVRGGLLLHVACSVHRGASGRG